ncbi:FG-GAP-like repeat-containing protein [Bradyrhizobium sp. CCBAU 11361]|uniref:FG-GAP-like repeat-containing protein n=1 Tax=Bradyrhizobium sp. CCBAU 11361 TaxID=1630812 RepID=UPI002305A744|nr:FG-GAP-like repeat-containing protein [Bradyrhizobium sp. CCBAU 11361]MDA9492080.1 hypothetical protein [Bradyrhizobium sp. CCBAU 11361]
MASSFTFSEETYSSGSANWVSSRDLDGDGDLDLVFSVPNDSQANVLMNQGDGTFVLTQSLFAPRVESLTIADLNGDSAPDIITGDNAFASAVGVFLNNGDGSFGPEVEYFAGPVIPHVETFDVNEDGKLDIIASSYYDGAISVLLGNGDGTFRPRMTFPVGGISNYGFAVADLGNGHGDIVLANPNNSQIYVMMGDGTGQFSSPTTINAAAVPLYVTVADLGDGNPDLIVGNRDSASISVYQGNGDGTFAPAVEYSVGNTPYTVAAADMNNDGILDLVAASAGSASISILLGNGDETFQPQIEIGTAAGQFDLIVGDFNGDGLNDISYTTGDGLHVLLNSTILNQNPAITSDGGGDTAAVSIAENTTAVTKVTATDPDAGQTLRYSIADGADGTLFTINETTGALAFTNAPDYENPTDAGANNVYDVTVQVSDGNGGIDVQAIAVTVQNLAGSTINGTNKADTLTGSGEEDFLYGKGGNDNLQGLGGNDYLDGGSGKDTMNGGAGADRFVFSAFADSTIANFDIVQGFVHGTDTIDIALIDASASKKGDQAFAFAGQNSTAVANSVTWYESGGNTFVQADVNGNTTADLRIESVPTSVSARRTFCCK